MKFYSAGKFKENVLEKKVEINPNEMLPQFVFNRLDYLIGFISEKSPDNTNPFVNNLEGKYRELSKSNYLSKYDLDLRELTADKENLSNHQSLVEAALNYYIQVLNLPSGRNWDETVKIVNRNYHQAFLHPRYYNLLTLIETLGREEAIRLWKRFFTQFIIDNRKPREKPFVDLETFLEEQIAAVDEENPSDWVVLFGMIADGKYAYRNDNCLWVDSLDDFPDSEIKYYVCCYGDYEGVKDLHESIVFTMEHTFAQGDPYCSRVLHDTRVDYDLRHPSKEFWDNMRPEK
ncbi:MAG: L-2-amino-thiazoline-4-carboxylic acid hydrolase [Candidatus Thorarchaeota archaeon]|jgi:hypothetical protein